MRISTCRFGALAAIVTLVGCIGTPVLVAKSAVVPASVNLSGQWQVRESTAGRIQRSPRDSLVDVFLRTGSSLKITQTHYGIFISFDRSIVEEYNFGENRMVSVGPVEASRVSGWEGNSYVIETMDKRGNKLVDSYWLENNNSILMRRIEIWERTRRDVVVEFAFDRV